jgi:hypothetical protein
MMISLSISGLIYPATVVTLPQVLGPEDNLPAIG